VSTKTPKKRTSLSGWLDEGAPGRSLATFKNCIALSGDGRGYTGCDWAAKMGFPVGMTALYAVLLGIVTWRHEMWRDELQAWLIARDSQSIADLFHNLRYETHPALWYLLLYIPAHVSWNPVSMQVINWLLATCNAWLILSARRLVWYIRILLVFGFFPFYLYGATARSYMLALLLLTAAARCFLNEHMRPRLGLALLALAIYTHVFAIPLVGVLYVGLVYFSAPNSWRRPGGLLRKSEFWVAGAVLLASLLVAYLTIRPPADMQSVYYGEGKSPVWDSFLMIGCRSWITFLPVPRSDLPKGWADLFVPNDHPTVQSAAISLALLALLGGSLRTRRARFIFLGSALVEAIAFAATIQSPQPWHYGFIFAGLILALLTDAYPVPGEPRRSWFPDPVASLVMFTCLAIQVAAAVSVSAMDLVRPFSETKEASTWLKQAGYDRNPIVIDQDFVGPGLVGYMQLKRVYYSRCQCYGSFIVFNRKWGMDRNVTPQELESIYHSAQMPVVVVTNKQLDLTTVGQLRLRPLQFFDHHPVLPSEAVFVYLQSPA
jgi:hypothetical protein